MSYTLCYIFNGRGVHGQTLHIPPLHRLRYEIGFGYALCYVFNRRLEYSALIIALALAIGLNAIVARRALFSALDASLSTSQTACLCPLPMFRFRFRDLYFLLRHG